MATNKIAIRQDTAANWTSADPVLEAGEFSLETDSGKLKNGDGSTAYTSLGYLRANNAITVTESYTVADNVDTVYVDASGGAVTVTMPALSGNLGRKITVRASDATNTITVSRDGSDTIANALTSVTLSSDRDYWTLEAGPDQWELVAGYEIVGTSTNYCTKSHDGVMVAVLMETVTDQAINDAYGSLYTGGRSWTYAAAFTSQPSIECGHFQWGAGASWGSTYNAAADQTTIGRLIGYDISSRATGTNVYIKATATGRWY